MQYRNYRSALRATDLIRRLESRLGSGTLTTENFFCDVSRPLPRPVGVKCQGGTALSATIRSGRGAR